MGKKTTVPISDEGLEILARKMESFVGKEIPLVYIVRVLAKESAKANRAILTEEEVARCLQAKECDALTKEKIERAAELLLALIFPSFKIKMVTFCYRCSSRVR